MTSKETDLDQDLKNLNIKESNVSKNDDNKQKNDHVESFVIGFWNIQGLMTKIDEEQKLKFEEWLKSKDIVALVETWVTSKQWNKLKVKNIFEKENEEIYKDFIWKKQYAIKKKENSPGRGSGGILVGVKKKGWTVEKDQQPCNGTMMIKVQSNHTKETWHICVVYQNKNYESIMKEVSKWTLERERERDGQLIMVGDWNLRIEKIKGFDEKWNTLERKSQDKKRNLLGDKWAHTQKYLGWRILNGCTPGDENGVWTRKKSKSVIDYVHVKGVEEKRVIELIVNKNYDNCEMSDHRPLEVTIKYKEEK